MWLHERDNPTFSHICQYFIFASEAAESGRQRPEAPAGAFAPEMPTVKSGYTVKGSPMPLGGGRIRATAPRLVMETNRGSRGQLCTLDSAEKPNRFGADPRPRKIQLVKHASQPVVKPKLSKNKII